MKGFTIFILVTFLGGVSFAQPSSFVLGFDSSGMLLIVQTNFELKSQKVQRFSTSFDALSSMKMLQQQVFEDSLNIQRLVFENNVKGNQIKYIISELERISRAPPNEQNQQIIKQKSPGHPIPDD